MTKYSEALEALDTFHGTTSVISHGINKGKFNTVLLTDEQRETIRQALQPAPTSAEVEEAIATAQFIVDSPNSYNNEWIMTLIKAARQPQKDNETLTIEDYKEAFEEHKRLVRELDISLNGETGAARQASLCDIVSQVKGIHLHSQQKDVRLLVEAVKKAMNISAHMKSERAMDINRILANAYAAFGEVV